MGAEDSRFKHGWQPVRALLSEFCKMNGHAKMKQDHLDQAGICRTSEVHVECVLAPGANAAQFFAQVPPVVYVLIGSAGGRDGFNDSGASCILALRVFLQ